jgi:hypothetical protein
VELRLQADEEALLARVDVPAQVAGSMVPEPKPRILNARCRRPLRDPAGLHATLRSVPYAWMEAQTGRRRRARGLQQQQQDHEPQPPPDPSCLIALAEELTQLDAVGATEMDSFLSAHPRTKEVPSTTLLP